MSGPHGPKGVVTERPKNFKQAWGRLFNYMGRYKAGFILAVVLAAIGAALSLFGPNLLSDMTNLIKDGLYGGSIDLDAVASIGSLLVALYAGSFILTFIQGYVMATVTQKTAGNLRDDIAMKINRIPLRYFDNSSSGDLMSRVTNDADTMGQNMNGSIGTLVSALTLFIGSIIMMFVTHAMMALVAIASTLIGFVLMVLIMRKSQKYFDIQQNNLGSMNGHVAEIYSAHDIVRSYNGGKRAKAEFDEINDRLAHSGFMSQFLSGLMMPLMTFIGNFGYVCVCVAGAAFVLNGTATIGTIVAFMVYIRLFTQPLQQISQALASMQSVAAGAERVFGFLDESELDDESDKDARIDAKGHVEFRDVHFGYLPDKEVIHGFSADIKPGQKVAIVGPTGAGKTTMVNLLMKFYEVNSGDIFIDGVSLKDMTRENVHDQFCMVLQDTWLFEGTIKENIVYCREGVTDDQVIEACKAVGLHHFIATLPDGYDTKLGDNATLSVGQKQQLTIARAMIDRSPMLILDEATSSVDTRTEKIIQDAMDRLAMGRTSFVIAHRLSTIKNADLILVMKNGSIIEHGTHEDLLNQGGFYCDLYNSQFEETEMD